MAGNQDRLKNVTGCQQVSWKPFIPKSRTPLRSSNLGPSGLAGIRLGQRYQDDFQASSVAALSRGYRAGQQLDSKSSEYDPQQGRAGLPVA
ncbi:hypothetical protein CF326_g2180 [Tilletia indica]|nr:hypothetical protein CF326_g2180 [Tilletia indica]